MGSVLVIKTVERVNKAASRNLVEGSLSSMFKALGINPITTEGRKGVKRKEGSKEERKNGRKKKKLEQRETSRREAMCLLLLLTRSSGAGFSAISYPHQGCLVFVLHTGQQIIAGCTQEGTCPWTLT